MLDNSSAVDRVVPPVGHSDSHRKPAHWAVVGGGMMGLTAALRLVQNGERVTIFEAAPELGGLTAPWKLDLAKTTGDTSEVESIEWDKFYHVILMSDSRLRNVLQELDLDKEIEWVQTKTGFYSGGKLYSLSSSIDFLKFPPLSLYQKFRLGSTIFFGSKIRDWRAMEGLHVEQWLRRWSGHSTYEKIWKPLLKAKLGDAYQRTAASFIWAYIDRMYKARRSGMKREMFGYVPGGYRRIIASFAKKLQNFGVTIVENAPVQQVVCIQEADGENHSIEVTFGKPDGLTTQVFDRVILTTPYKQVETAVTSLTDDEQQKLRATEYLGVICTSLILDKPLNGFYVTNIIDDWVPLTGIIEMGAIVTPQKLGGGYLVYLPQYVMSNDPRLDESDTTIHNRCIETLEKMFPGQFQRESVRSIQTAKARYVMALPTLNFSENRPPAVLSQQGVYLLNSARIVKGNLNVNETLELLEEDFQHLIWPNHLKLAASSEAERHKQPMLLLGSPALR